MPQIEPLTIFHSYAHADQTTFGMFLSGLRAYAAQHNISIDDWYDENIAKGRAWREEIATQIDSRKTMTVWLTPNSVTRPEVEKEVKAALEKGKFVLPILFTADTILPKYLEAYQVVKAFEYATHFDDLYAKVLETLKNPYPPDLGIPHRKHNLYVATLGKHGGRTSVITALNQLLVDGYHFPGYFKPFQMRDDDRRDITFLYDKFKLSELSLSIETFAPFEYAASLPACTETQLRDAFNRISHNRRPVMIEGILFKPKNIGLRQMIVDVFDARLLLIIDHTAIENAQEPPTELLNKIAVEMGHVPVAFIFNKVPNGKLSDIAKEVRQVALDLRFKEVGEIAFDERLTAISVRDLIAITGGQLLTTPTDEALDDLAWCFGQTSYSEQEAFEFYQQQKLNNEHPGRVIFSGGSKLGLHFRLARLGFHLFLTGVENASTIEPALLRLAEENKKCVVTFSKPTHEVMKDIEIAFRRGVPFCYEKKLEYLTEATSKLDKNMMDLVLKRSS